MLGIIVKTQFEATHCYPGAKDPVAYLQYPHRHMFYVEAEVETFHEDREIEFITLKKGINYFISHYITDAPGSDIGKTSCEQLCKTIQSWIKEEYSIPKELKEHTRTRWVNVKVFEDNENGSFIREF